MFTFREFRKCVRAIVAYAGGYKLGEGYALGRIEKTWTKGLDAESWQLGYDLATKRNPYRNDAWKSDQGRFQ